MMTNSDFDLPFLEGLTIPIECQLSPHYESGKAFVEWLRDNYPKWKIVSVRDPEKYTDLPSENGLGRSGQVKWRHGIKFAINEYYSGDSSANGGLGELIAITMGMGNGITMFYVVAKK